MTFDKWMEAVDAVISNSIGLSHDDLPDDLWMDWYEDGLTPQEAWEAYKENNPEYNL